MSEKLNIAPYDVQKIIKKAYQIGFDDIGFTSSFSPKYESYFKEWLSDGKFAGMNWLAKNTDKRLNPDLILPGTTSAIVLVTSYYHELDEGKEFSIAKYAHGEDYHNWIKQRLERLAEFVKEMIPDFSWRSFVDTGPILERDLAAKAGIGWVGKNTCLINKESGSFVFLSVILCNTIFTSTIPEIDRCETCNLCLEACPTNALDAYQLDASKCLAYHNIEARGEREQEYWPKIGNHLVGCDICQDVCPWNHNVESTRNEAWVETMKEANFSNIEEFLKLSKVSFKKLYKNTAISRIKYEDFMRNVFLVIANLEKKELYDDVCHWVEENQEMDLAEVRYCLEKISGKMIISD